MKAPFELKAGMLMWACSWVVSFQFNHDLGLALFCTSYIAMFQGLWKVATRNAKEVS